VESYYLAMPYLSWQTVVVGDPLCAPFASGATDQPLHRGLDADTGLPAIFAERRLEAATRTGLNREAIKRLLKLEALTSRGETDQTEALLVAALDLEPRLTAAQLRLAMLYDERKAVEQAVDRYRRVLAQEPQNVVALNNLAYLVATAQARPQDALELAERAYRVAPSALIADTLGWIHHLLGNDRLAAPLIDQARRALPRNVDVLLHAATVHATLGNLDTARRVLDDALAIDATLAGRADVKALREKIRLPPPEVAVLAIA
jgi:tetratricopeptide (TPR) repeat protein